MNVNKNTEILWKEWNRLRQSINLESQLSELYVPGIPCFLLDLMWKQVEG